MTLLRCLVLLAVFAPQWVAPTTGHAANAGCVQDSRGFCSDVAGGSDDFQAVVTHEGPHSAPVPGTRGRGSKQPLSPTYIDRNFVPTCTGNTAFDGGTLCTAAVEACPAEDEVRFWIFETTIVRATGRPAAGAAPRLAGTVCMGPDEPVLDPAVAIGALVQREFKSAVVLSGNAIVSPRPETLVNVPTRFETDAPQSYDIPLTLLNQSVLITATAERYTWHLGDGATRVSTDGRGYLEHAYRQAGPRAVSVDIEWSGTFSVNGAAAQPISGTVVTEGEPVALEVRQARSRLVRD